MRTCLYYLALNPESYRRLQIEIDMFYDENRLEQPITYLQTQQLPYLQAVVKEATRLLPSIVFQLLRYAPPDFTVRGHKIPEGTPVGISPIAQNRDEDIWGPDADAFRPERWIEDEEKAKYYDKSTMTFGGNGPRMCIGRNIALVSRTPIHSPPPPPPPLPKSGCLSWCAWADLLISRLSYTSSWPKQFVTLTLSWSTRHIRGALPPTGLPIKRTCS